MYFKNDPSLSDMHVSRKSLSLTCVSRKILSTKDQYIYNFIVFSLVLMIDSEHQIEMNCLKLVLDKHWTEAIISPHIEDKL